MIFMVSDMHVTVRQLFAEAKNPIYDFKSFRYYLSKVKCLPESFYKDLWKNPAPDELVCDSLIKPYSPNSINYSYSQQALKVITGKVPFLEYFYSHTAKQSLCSIKDLVNQYGNCRVGLINHAYKRNPLISDIDSIDIYNYVIYQSATDRSQAHTFSLISFEIGGYLTPAFVMKDFYIYQLYQSWPIMYFKVWPLNSISSASGIDNNITDNKTHINGLIMHNPLYDYYYLITYYWKYDGDKSNGMLGNFTLNTTCFVKLMPQVCPFLFDIDKLSKYLDICLPNDYLTDFQVPHWFYGAHSYIYRKWNDGSSIKKNHLPSVNELFQAAYRSYIRCEPYNDVYAKFLNFVQHACDINSKEGDSHGQNETSSNRVGQASYLHC